MLRQETTVFEASTSATRLVAEPRLRYEYEHEEEEEDSYTSVWIIWTLFKYVHTLLAKVRLGLRCLRLIGFVNLTISEGIAVSIVQVDHGQLEGEGDVSLNHTPIMCRPGCCDAWHERRIWISGWQTNTICTTGSLANTQESALDLSTFKMQTTFHLHQTDPFVENSVFLEHRIFQIFLSD